MFSVQKYLRINITDNNYMDWSYHISEFSSETTKALGFLHMNLAFAPRSSKEVAYKSLVRPKLEYAVPLWSLTQNFRLIRLRKFRGQHRRWGNAGSVGEMLNELEWPSLEAHRDQSSLLLFH